MHSFQTIECERKVITMAAELARGLGFDYCTYGLRTPIPLTRTKTAMYSNYPLAWQTIYQEKEYSVIDPTVQQAIRSLSPIFWSDDLFASTPELWEEAQSFGLQAGLAQVCRDIGGMTGLLVLARSGEVVTTTEWQTKACHILWLVQAVHMCMARIVAPKLLPALSVDLSRREAEVLRWTGDGKTAGEIAAILQISERTVNFHISNVITKLQVTNKTAAVLQASLLGLL
ncbi:MAG: autoinducer binding domain-containing protein [Acidithiobacillus sp.]|nr:autoinducer binding domain-containing protein [Acidithiobacillus sp.]